MVIHLNSDTKLRKWQDDSREIDNFGVSNAFNHGKDPAGGNGVFRLSRLF
jgi:hypothetical protein